MKKIILLLVLINIIFTLKVLKHKCAHDKINKRIAKHYGETEQDFVNGRNLQQKPARNMVISYDLSFFSKLTLSAQDQLFKQSCEKAIQLAIDYFSRLIKIVPKTLNDMKWTYSNNDCDIAQVPKGDRDNGKDSDLHLYITYTNEPDDTYLAYAAWCRFLPKIGPTHGIVNFNYGILNGYKFNDNQQFEDLMEIVIHEMTHVMGFSGDDVENWIDSNKQPHVNPTVQQVSPRGGTITLLRTPNVLAHVKQYYACDTANGMPFENQGGDGSAGSHWETTAIMDEYMNAAISLTQAYFSKFTTALLRDTGYYAEVNGAMEEKTFYGKDEGCSFLYAKCDLKKREFCEPSQSRGCDYHYHGVSACGLNTFTDPGCNIWKPYSNTQCYDTTNTANNADQKKYYGVEYGPSSKCFVQNLLVAGYNPKKNDALEGNCYKYECQGTNTVNIYVAGNKVVCTKNLEEKTVNGFSGKIICPEKLDEFCSFKRYCPNNCSTKGYCNNGKCFCAKGFKGEDCSAKA